MNCTIGSAIPKHLFSRWYPYVLRVLARCRLASSRPTAWPFSGVVPNVRKDHVRCDGGLGSSVAAEFPPSRYMLRRARPEPVPNSELQELPSSLFIYLALPRRVEVHELANPMIEP